MACDESPFRHQREESLRLALEAARREFETAPVDRKREAREAYRTALRRFADFVMATPRA